jgi:hypothetical protein
MNIEDTNGLDRNQTLRQILIKLGLIETTQAAMLMRIDSIEPRLDSIERTMRDGFRNAHKDMQILNEHLHNEARERIDLTERVETIESRIHELLESSNR